MVGRVKLSLTCATVLIKEGCLLLLLMCRPQRCRSAATGTQCAQRHLACNTATQARVLASPLTPRKLTGTGSMLTFSEGGTERPKSRPRQGLLLEGQTLSQHLVHHSGP